MRGHLSFLQIRRLARRISKDLITVPFEVGLRGVRTPGLRAADGLTCETDQPIAGALGVSEVLGDQKPVIVIEADRTSVERLVVVCAQGETVFLGVGAAVAVPVDVGGLYAEIGGTEQGIVAADRATVLVDAEDGVAEGRIARSSPSHLDVRHSHGVEDIVVERWLPMVFEQLLGDAVNEVGFRAETIVQFRGEAPVCSDLTNDREAWIVPVRCGVEVGLKRLSLGNLPEAVRLQVPKRILGSSRARRAEVLQEPSDVLLYSSKRNQALITALERGQCVEQEQGLVRSRSPPRRQMLMSAKWSRISASLDSVLVPPTGPLWQCWVVSFAFNASETPGRWTQDPPGSLPGWAGHVQVVLRGVGSRSVMIQAVVGGSRLAVAMQVEKTRARKASR